MLVERVELTLSHVDLGRLNEFAVMTLFGNAHSHRITLGTGGSISDITDQAGAPLYPGYYWTHLKVPPASQLQLFRVWDTVAVGVDVHGYGSTLLASSYVLGRPGDVDEGDASAWPVDTLPSMRAGSMFYVDGGDAEPRPAAPKRGCVAALPSLSAAPPAVQRYRELRDLPSIDPAFVGKLSHAAPIPYELVTGRDLRPERGLMFSRFILVADCIERQFLQQAWPPIPLALIDCLSVLERETCYHANLRGERELRGAVRARLERCPPTFHGDDKTLLSAGILTAVIDLYDDANVLLMTTKVKKLLALPSTHSRLVTLAARTMAEHGE